MGNLGWAQFSHGRGVKKKAGCAGEYTPHRTPRKMSEWGNPNLGQSGPFTLGGPYLNLPKGKSRKLRRSKEKTGGANVVSLGVVIGTKSEGRRKGGPLSLGVFECRTQTGGRDLAGKTLGGSRTPAVGQNQSQRDCQCPQVQRVTGGKLRLRYSTTKTGTGMPLFEQKGIG